MSISLDKRAEVATISLTKVLQTEADKGSFGIPSVSGMKDEDFYDKLVGEFLPRWLPAARAAGIVTV